MTTADLVWEWRTFGGGCDEAERKIRAHPLSAGPYRATHIVSDLSGADVQLVDGELRLRVLRQTLGPLEQWKPVLRVPMPIDDISVRRMFGYLDLRPPTTARESYTLHQFMTEIVAPAHALASVQVGQIRHVATMWGCTVDIAEITIDGTPSTTLGIQGEDPSAVNGLLADLGLTGRPNVNIVAALKQQLAASAHA